MNKKLILSFATSVMIAAAPVVFAQANENVDAAATEAHTGQKHPRVNQVNNRIERQKNHVAKAEEAGKLTPKQADRIENRLSKEEEQLQNAKDENGHITKAEQLKLNKELNKNKNIARAQAHHNKVKDSKDEHSNDEPAESEENSSSQIE